MTNEMVYKIAEAHFQGRVIHTGGSRFRTGLILLIERLVPTFETKETRFMTIRAFVRSEYDADGEDVGGVDFEYGHYDLTEQEGRSNFLHRTGWTEEFLQSVERAQYDRCECCDTGDNPPCDERTGDTARCTNRVAAQVFRVDMDDLTGKAMCEWCAKDAVASGVFAYADVLRM